MRFVGEFIRISRLWILSIAFVVFSSLSVSAAVPNLLSSSPVDGTYHHAVETDLTLTFDVAVIPKTGNIYVKKYDDDSTVDMIPAFDPRVTGIASKIISVDLASLDVDTHYYIEIDSNAFSTIVGDFFPGLAKDDLDFYTHSNTNPDIKLWLDASDSSSMKSSSNKVSAWYDKSGNANHFTQNTNSAQPIINTGGISGRQALYFDGKDRLDSNNSIFDYSKKRFTIVSVHTKDGGASARAIISSNKIRYYTDRLVTLSPTKTSYANYFTKPVVKVTVYDGSKVHFYVDGVFESSKTHSLGSGSNTKFSVGSPIPSGNYGSNMKGFIGEVILYDKALSTSEIDQISTDLIDKWKPEPTTKSDLVFWFDAADTSTITKNNNGKITEWKDKSGNNRHAVKESGISAPEISANKQNNHKVLRFYDDSSLRVDYTLTEQNKTSFIVVKPFVNDNGLRRVLYTPATSAHHSIRVNNQEFVYGDSETEAFSSGFKSHTMSYGTNSVDVRVDGAAHSSPTWTPKGTGSYLTIGDSTKGLTGELAEIIVYDRVLTQQEIEDIERYLAVKWNLEKPPFALEFSPVDEAGGVLLDDPLIITFDQDIQAGDSSKTLVIKHVADDSIFETINADDTRVTITGDTLTVDHTRFLGDTEYYVVVDEGFVEALNSKPYAGFTLSTEWNFKTSPFDTNGLALWLDGSDATTMKIASNYVTEWNDKSVNANKASQLVGSLKPYLTTGYDTKNALRFDNDYMTLADTVAVNDVFQVFRTVYADQFYGATAILGGTTTADNIYTFKSGTNDFTLSPADYLQDGDPEAGNKILDPSDYTAILTTASNPSKVRALRIGRSAATGSYHNVAEVIAFNRQLSDVERTDIFRYLAVKWGLTGPKFISGDPADNKANVATSTTTLTATFDRNVSAGTGSITIKDAATDADVQVLDVTSGNVSFSGTQMTLTLPSSLAAGKDYYVVFEDGSINDDYGLTVNKYDDRKSFWNFRTAPASAPSSFDLKSLDGLELWYDAADSSTITQSGNLVSNLLDKSGNNRYAHRADGYRPTINSVQQNNLDVLEFKGGLMSINDSFFKTGDVFRAFKSPTNLFSQYGSHIGTVLSAYRHTLYQYRNDTLHTAVGQVFKNDTLVTDKYLGPINEFMILETTPEISYKRLHRLHYQESYRFYSHLGELIVFDRKLSSGERSQVNEYLMKKWGVFPIELVSTNPAANQLEVPVDARLELTFDRDIVLGAGDIKIYKVDDDSLFEVVDLNTGDVTMPDTKTISIKTVKNFDPNTNYYVLIDDDAITNSEGYFYRGINDKTSFNFKTVIPSGTAFDPSQVSGLQLWLDALDPATISNPNGVVSVWNDKSVNARHARMADSTYQPEHGFHSAAARDFMAFRNDYMELDNNGFVGKNIFYVFKSPSTKFNTYAHALGTKSNAERHSMFSSGGTTYHSDPRPTTLMKNGKTLPNTSSFSPLKETQIHMITPYNSTKTRDFRVGAAEGYRGNIDIGEIIVYNRDLTTDEIAKVNHYLHKKWAVSAPEITALTPEDNAQIENGSVGNFSMRFDRNVMLGNGDYIYIRSALDDSVAAKVDINSTDFVVTNNGVNFNLSSSPGGSISTPGNYYISLSNGALLSSDGLPFYDLEDKTTWTFSIKGPGMTTYDGAQLWLDASDASTITKSGSKLTYWRDKSGNSRHAYQTDTSLQPEIGNVTQNSMDTVSFDNSSMSIEDPSFKAVEVVQIFRVTTNKFASSGGFFGSLTSAERPYAFKANSSEVNKTSPALDKVYRNLENLDYTSDMGPFNYFILNSMVTKNVNSTYEYQVGKSFDAFAGGDLAELIVFDHELTVDEREELFLDLAAKWDIDIQKPKIISTTPADDEADVDDMITKVTIKFDEPVYANYGTIKIRRNNDNKELQSLLIDSPLITGWGTDTIDIGLLHKLYASSNFSVIISKRAITDAYYNRHDGLSLTDPEDWDFTTQRDNSDILFKWKMF